MATFLGPLLAAVVLALAPSDRVETDKVVDGKGKPIADAQVVIGQRQGF